MDLKILGGGLFQSISRSILCGVISHGVHLLGFRTLTPPFKIWKVLRYPSYLCLRLTIPVVDEELDSMRGWNQKLHVLQCLLAPILTVFATNTAFITVKGNIGDFFLSCSFPARYHESQHRSTASCISEKPNCDSQCPLQGFKMLNFSHVAHCTSLRPDVRHPTLVHVEAK